MVVLIGKERVELSDGRERHVQSLDDVCRMGREYCTVLCDVVWLSVMCVVYCSLPWCGVARCDSVMSWVEACVLEYAMCGCVCVWRGVMLQQMKNVVRLLPTAVHLLIYCPGPGYVYPSSQISSVCVAHCAAVVSCLLLLAL